MPQRIDIVLPCFNPPTGWWEGLQAFHKTLPTDIEANYLLVNDGSTDPQFLECLRDFSPGALPVRSICYPKNRGKGYALREGVRNSTAPLIVYTDVDFPFTHQSMMFLIEELRKGNFDVLAGSRDASYYANKMSGFRKALSRSFRFFLRKILKMKVEDTQCGLKGFNQKGKDEFLKTRINRYLFDFEFIYRCSRNPGVRITSIPVELKSNVVFSKMRLKVLVQESLNLLRVILFS